MYYTKSSLIIRWILALHSGIEKRYSFQIFSLNILAGFTRLLGSNLMGFAPPTTTSNSLIFLWIPRRRIVSQAVGSTLLEISIVLSYPILSRCSWTSTKSLLLLFYNSYTWWSYNSNVRPNRFNLFVYHCKRYPISNLH